MTGRVKISKQQEGQSADNKDARKIKCRGNLFFVKPVLFIPQYRADQRRESGEARWRENRGRKKKGSYFCNCFFCQCWEKSGGESFEKFKQPWQPGCSGINLFKQGENPSIINTDRNSEISGSVAWSLFIAAVRLKQVNVFRNIKADVIFFFLLRKNEPATTVFFGRKQTINTVEKQHYLSFGVVLLATWWI